MGDLHDGLLLTIAVKVQTQENAVPPVSDDTVWVPVSDAELKEKLLGCYNQTDGCCSVPFLY